MRAKNPKQARNSRYFVYIGEDQSNTITRTTKGSLPEDRTRNTEKKGEKDVRPSFARILGSLLY